MAKSRFWIGVAVVIAIGFAAPLMVTNEYYYFAGYLVLQFVVLATAWNILGGYTGYVNFGSAAFFAVGAYTSIALLKFIGPPIPVLILAGALISGLIGLGTGYLTLRLRGVFFAIATLALAIVLETLVVNWEYVGGAGGTFVMRPKESLIYDSFVKYLFLVMWLVAVGAVVIARTVEVTKIGRGLAAIRDNEEAAESMGVPTLRLKLLSTTLSGALMGAAGAPFPYFITFLDPPSAFNLGIAVNAVAMPMIGGTLTWIGPVVGALLLGTLQQVATVTISSELNLLIVGVVLVIFVIIAPDGIVGMVQKLFRRGRKR